MKRILSFLLAALLCTALLAGCNTPAQPPQSKAPGGKLQIVATIFPHYDFARAVAGDKADVTMLIKPGAETHTYDPSPADIVAIQNADIFIYTGGHNDAWADSILASMPEDGPLVLRMMDFVAAVEEETVEGMQAAQGHSHEEDAHDDHSQGNEGTHDDHAHGESDGHEEDEHSHENTAHLDEHIWTSPLNAITMVGAVAQKLEQLDTENALAYRQNAEAYVANLNGLDAEFEQIVQTGKRKMLVFADRFPMRYFTDAYGLTYRAAFPGCSVDTNPSAGTVAGLIDIVRDEKLPYVYTIELSSGSIAKTVSAETGCGVLTLHSAQNVTREEFESGATYLDIMRQNAENLRKGLN